MGRPSWPPLLEKEGDVKVPIEVDGEFTPDDNKNDWSKDEVNAQDEALEPEFEEFDEEAMVEAAKRAGEAAAEEDFKADAARACEEAGDLLAQLAEAEEAVDAAKKEAAEATDRLTRLQADWENYRRRTAAERLAEKERAAEKLVSALLPVLDDMERASEHAMASNPDDENLMQFVAGVNAVHDKMIGILAKEGVSVIDPIGEAFNPLRHQAVSRVEDPSVYDETVAQVYQKGYELGGKVIRAAMVTVTFGGPKRPAPEAEA
ncbi:MAG: nucleotide exchange factor GrpE [Atopobiaceae bacterium]|nr:nucleotide exchange factor GrpE [Atopobiaceae bacterium]